MSPKCPRCRKKPISYIELWKNRLSFGVEDSGSPEDIGYLDSGYPYAVVADCSCGHQWKLRGIKQITEVRNLYPPNAQNQPVGGI
jgi:hypothetical protein